MGKQTYRRDEEGVVLLFLMVPWAIARCDSRIGQSVRSMLWIIKFVGQRILSPIPSEIV
jgi:hypothetical protein